MPENDLPTFVVGEGSTNEHGFVMHKELEDGRVIAITPMTFGKFRITIGHGYMTYDSGY